MNITKAVLCLLVSCGAVIESAVAPRKPVAPARVSSASRLSSMMSKMKNIKLPINLAKTKQFFKRNKKALVIGGASATALALAYMGYKKYYAKNGDTAYDVKTLGRKGNVVNQIKGMFSSNNSAEDVHEALISEGSTPEGSKKPWYKKFLSKKTSAPVKNSQE
jgi:hypothetical protein